MSERDTDFDDLVGETADTDEAADAGKTPDKQGEGADDKTPPDADDASKDGDDDGNADKDDEGDKGAKDAADADKEGDDDKDAKDAAKKDQPMVPKAALESTKRRLRETQQRLKRIEDRLGAEDAEIAKAAIPDPKTQPAEHARYLQQQTLAVQLNDRLNFSEYEARKEHGDDVVSEAFEWANAQMEDAKTGEQFAKTLFAHAHPYDYAVSLFKKAQEAPQGGGAGSDDPEYAKFLAWKASQTGEGGKPPVKQQQQEEKAARPQSLAQRSSASGPKGDDLVVDPFASEFDR